MIDEVLDLFDRDRSASHAGRPRRRGLRGLLDRLIADDERTEQHGDGRRRDHEDWHDPDEDQPRGRPRRRERFDFDED